MAEITSSQFEQIITLLHELKSNLSDVKADINSLSEKFDAYTTPQPKRAVISVPSIDGWNTESITLSAEVWSKVQHGERVVVTNEIDLGGTLHRCYWEFCGGIGGTIKWDVEYGVGDIETEYENTLVKDDIEEID
jgi:hypothetical protein